MHCLLTTLGHSPWIVAEAFLTAEQTYDRVRVLTSSSPNVRIDELEAFFRDYPQTRFSVLRVPGLTDLSRQEEHVAFEEALYPWYLEALREDPSPDVCISGGFKSMSASLQKAAHLLGARDVFHVLADQNPDSAAKVREALQQKQIRRISMGAEPGWASLRRWKTAPDSPEPPKIRATIKAQLETMRRRIDSPGPAMDAESLPFPDLALLSPDIQDWLQQPLHAEEDRAWVAALPKPELHCHLGGFATAGRELHAVRAVAHPDSLPPLDPPSPPPGWPTPEQPIPLHQYMRLGDANGSTLLHDPACLREQIRQLFQYLIRERILYAEIRCSPANYARHGRSALQVLRDIQDAFARCRQEWAGQTPLLPRISLLIIVTRRQSGDLSSVARHLALAVAASGQKDDCPVVGVDLAGFEEKETRPVYFQTDFNIAHRCGLAVTAHAGENDDVESIWQAVYKLSARRLGHALHLDQSEDLFRVARDRAIGVEMCPMANFQIHGYAPMPDRPPYPLLDFLRRGLKVSVNTDNPGISAAGLTDNLCFLARLCPGIRRIELLRCLRNGIDTAFLDPNDRTQLLQTASAATLFACQNHAPTLFHKQ